MQNEEVQTQKICLWNGIFCTELPIEFQVADEKLIKKKFPYIAKPEYIWVNEQEMQIITFHLLHKELKNEQIKIGHKGDTANDCSQISRKHRGLCLPLG